MSDGTERLSDLRRMLEARNKAEAENARLREERDDLKAQADAYYDRCKAAVRERDKLREERAELKRHYDVACADLEHARQLLGEGGERDARLRSENDKLREERDRLQGALLLATNGISISRGKELVAERDAALADAARLREALGNLLSSGAILPFFRRIKPGNDAVDAARAALTDTNNPGAGAGDGNSPGESAQSGSSPGAPASAPPIDPEIAGRIGDRMFQALQTARCDERTAADERADLAHWLEHDAWRQYRAWVRKFGARMGDPDFHRWMTAEIARGSHEGASKEGE